MNLRFRLPLIILLVISLTACSLVPARSELSRNRETWEKSAISHYRYKVFISCFCPFWEMMPLTIEVRNNQVISMVTSNGAAIEQIDRDYFNKFASIDKVFDFVSETIKGKADKVTVTYDRTHGFPIEIQIDYIKLAVDDELSIQIADFEILE